MSTLNNWQPEVRSLLHTLKTHGFVIRSVNNGENVTASDSPDFIPEIMACDEAYLYVTAPSGKRGVLFLVFGNSPGELVCDHSEDTALEAVADEHYTRWNSRKQPTIET